MNSKIKCICKKELDINSFKKHFKKCKLFLQEFNKFDFKISILLREYLINKNNCFLVIFLLKRYIKLIEKIINELDNNNKEDIISYDSSKNEFNKIYLEDNLNKSINCFDSKKELKDVVINNYKDNLNYFADNIKQKNFVNNQGNENILYNKINKIKNDENKNNDSDKKDKNIDNINENRSFEEPKYIIQNNKNESYYNEDINFDGNKNINCNENVKKINVSDNNIYNMFNKSEIKNVFKEDFCISQLPFNFKNDYNENGVKNSELYKNNSCIILNDVNNDKSNKKKNNIRKSILERRKNYDFIRKSLKKLDINDL